MESNSSKMAVAIIAGVAAGAAAWYLMTTENGKQNWSTLIDIAKDISDKLIDVSKDQGSSFASAGREASEFIGKRASEALDNVKSYQ